MVDNVSKCLNVVIVFCGIVVGLCIVPFHAEQNSVLLKIAWHNAKAHVVVSENVCLVNTNTSL